VHWGKASGGMALALECLVHARTNLYCPDCRCGEGGNRRKEGGVCKKKDAESLIKIMLGEPAKALGSLMAVPLTKRLHRNLITAAIEAKKRLAEAGVSPKEVPLSIIHPALQGAALEENPELQAAWANLIANAADPRYEDKVLPSFVVMLKELSPQGAVLLKILYEDASKRRPKRMVEGTRYSLLQIQTLFDKAQRARQTSPPGLKQGGAAVITEVSIMIGVLKRMCILQDRSVQNLVNEAFREKFVGQVSITTLGKAFFAACQPPPPATEIKTAGDGLPGTLS